MSDMIETLFLRQSGKNRFGPNSRYYGLETKSLETSGGDTVTYLERRFVPPEENFVLQQEHTVVEGDRLDNLAARYFGDPELFWRMCDANSTLHPDELTEAIGTKVLITLPEGIPGNQDE